MINADAWIVSFVGQNWISLSLAIGLLRILAKITPWVIDDKIHTLLAGTLGMIKKPPVGGLPNMENRSEEVK